MGRPRKNPREVHAVVLSIRVTQEQHDVLKNLYERWNRAYGPISWQDWLRSRLPTK